MPRTADGNDVERLFELYEQKLYRVAFAILHDEGQAEDAVMSAFEKVIRNGLMKAPPDSPEAKRLMLSVIRSVSIDRYRKNARERERIVHLDALESQDALEDVSGAFTQDATAPESGFDSLVEPLPTTYRAVVDQRFAQGKTVRETATTLGISEAAVRKRQQRAIEMLRKREGESA